MTHSANAVRLPIARLQDPELALLDRELDVAHVAVVALERGHHVHQPAVRRPGRAARARRCACVLRIPATTSSPCAFAEVVAVRDLLAGRRVARERHAGARVLAAVAEHHRHDVHRGAEVVADLVLTPVVDRPLAVPRAEDGVDRQAQLVLRVLREVLARCARGRSRGSVRSAPLRSSASRSVSCAFGPFAALASSSACSNASAGTSITILPNIWMNRRYASRANRTSPPVCVGEPLDRAVVQAEVQDGVHHPRHRELRARAHARPGAGRRDRRASCPSRPGDAPRCSADLLEHLRRCAALARGRSGTPRW